MLERDSKKLNWSTIIGVAVFHIVAVGALFTFSWENLLAAAILWWVAGSFGIGIGYHRLLTHRGFKAPRWLVRRRYLALECGLDFPNPVVRPDQLRVTGKSACWGGGARSSRIAVGRARGT